MTGPSIEKSVAHLVEAHLKNPARITVVSGGSVRHRSADAAGSSASCSTACPAPRRVGETLTSVKVGHLGAL